MNLGKIYLSLLMNASSMPRLDGWGYLQTHDGMSNRLYITKSYGNTSVLGTCVTRDLVLRRSQKSEQKS